MSLVHFVGSDVPPPPEYRRTMPGLWIVPSLGTAIAVVFNLPNYTGIDLKIPRAALADIFIGRIRKWSELAEWNERLTGVRENISLVVQADGAESYWLTSALSSFSTEWRGKVGISSKPAWPTFTVCIQDNIGMLIATQTTPYSLGYMSLLASKQFGAPTALIQNFQGAWVAPTTRGVAAALDMFAYETAEIGEAIESARDFSLSIVDPQRNVSYTQSSAADVYPISVLTYIMFDDTASVASEVFERIIYLLYWIWTAPEAAKEAEAHGFSPIAPNLIAPIVSQLRQASSRIADSTAFGSNPYKGIVDRVLYRFNPCVNGAGAAEPYAPKLVARPALRLFFVCCISHRCVATGGVPCTSGGWRVHPPTQR
jgi:ABC-type phosphate transport system substrate-binding protein